jgi:uncharacterized protein (DUF305 family)
MAIQRRRGAALLLAALIMGPRSLLAQAASQEKTGGEARSPSQRLHQAMLVGIQEMQEFKPSGDVDRDFAHIMRVHHKQAVDIAKEQLASGKSAEMKTLARHIVEDQTREIAQLDRWLASKS